MMVCSVPSVASSAAPVLHPIAEIPFSGLTDQSTFQAVFQKAVNDVADSIPVFEDDFRIVKVFKMIPNHKNPEKTEFRNDLREVCRIARKRQSGSASGMLELSDCLTAEPVVSGRKIGNQRLNAGVSDILKLFPVGTIFKMLMNAASQRMPCCPGNALQHRNAEFKRILQRRRT